MTHREEIAELISALQAENREARAEAKAEAIEREIRIFLTQAKVSPYSGESNPKRIQKFIHDVRRISEGFSLNDAQLIVVAGRNMRGAAEEWYQEYKDNERNHIDSFEKFHKKLRENFSRGYDKQEQYHKFNSLRQIGRVEDFNLQFRKAVSEFSNDYFSPEMRLHQYLEKLKFHIKREVKCRNPKDLEEAMRIALIFDSNYYGPGNSTNINKRKDWKPKPQNIETRNSYYNDKQSNDDMEIDNLNLQQVQKLIKKNKICFNCQKEGHYATNCPYKSKN